MCVRALVDAGEMSRAQADRLRKPDDEQACDPQAHVSQAHVETHHEAVTPSQAPGRRLIPRKPLSEPAISLPPLAVRRAGEYDDALASSPSGFWVQAGVWKTVSIAEQRDGILLSSP
jgi:hypothetical protein